MSAASTSSRRCRRTFYTTKFGETRNTPCVRFPSSLRPVHRCNSLWKKVVVPEGFPISTIALTCRMCGFVFCYIDDAFGLDVMDPAVALKAKKERPPRRWVVRRGVAIEPDVFDLQERLIEQRLRERVPVAVIAAELNLPEAYVHAVGRLSHVL